VLFGSDRADAFVVAARRIKYAGKVFVTTHAHDYASRHSASRIASRAAQKTGVADSSFIIR
jgi:hypothetical protein